ncbi:MAG: N-acetyltransferase family protein [Faecalibacillus faecis]
MDIFFNLVDNKTNGGMSYENRDRYAKLEDAARLVEIYCYYVEKTAITFEYEVPAVEEFQQRMVHVMEKYPYLVAKVDIKLSAMLMLVLLMLERLMIGV